MLPKTIIAACCVALYADAACADDKIYLACLTSETFPGNLSIDLKPASSVAIGSQESPVPQRPALNLRGGTPTALPRQAKYGKAYRPFEWSLVC